MEISRLIFTKETKEKMEKGLNATQRGILRWSKIKEAEDEGRLTLAKNRNEVANIAGFTELNKTRGYQWVSNMISRGHLKEVVLGIGKDRKMEYEYHVIGDPDYSRNRARNAKLNKHKREQKQIEKMQQMQPIVQISEAAPQDVTVLGELRYKMEIVRGDTTIKIELTNYNEIGELVKAILRGE